MHKEDIGVNTGSRRKGSLTLWKLTPPNLILRGSLG